MACALLYNFKDAARLQKVRFALFKLGVSGRIVAPEELSQPIGYLCDLEGFSPVEETVEGGFSDEMLVLCGLPVRSSTRCSRLFAAAAWSSRSRPSSPRTMPRGVRSSCTTSSVRNTRR